MRRWRLALIAVVGVTVVFSGVAVASGKQSSGSITPSASAAAPDTPVAMSTARPTPPPEPIPPTPGPPTPTPALPEEGGPSGGVLAGHLYVDMDRSGSLTPGDRPMGGGVSAKGLDLVDGGYPYLFAGTADRAGRWEIRGVPDGHYRVMWDASFLPKDQWPLTIPPVETINLNPADTIHDNIVHVITRTVEIKGANRILDIDFGIPPQPSVPGASRAPQLPATGTGGGSIESLWLLYTVIALSAALGLGGASLVRRRTNTRYETRTRGDDV